jgi:phosphohistidine phosphatase
MQELILFRHGIAEDMSTDGTDAERRLTEEGLKKTRQAAEGLARFADKPDVILTSPLVRAVQTAQIAGEVFGRTPQTMDLLADCLPEEILAELLERPEGVVMIVGHEPTFSMIVERLCTEGELDDFVQVKKAGAASVDVSEIVAGAGRGRLLWLATPKMLRALAP